MIAIIIGIGIFILLISIIIINWYLNEKGPEKRVKAVLVKKGPSIDMDVNNYSNNTTYTLRFDVNGEIKKFRVRRKIYKKYSKNQEGILVFKRKKFIDFIV